MDGAINGIMITFRKKVLPAMVVRVMAYAKKKTMTVTIIVVAIETYRLCQSAFKVYEVVKYFWKFARVKLASPNSPPLKKLNLRIAARGNNIKKQSSSPMKIVTVGTMNLSISIRVAETWYGVVTASAGDEVFIV